MTVPLGPHLHLRVGGVLTGKGTTYGLSSNAVTPFRDVFQGTLTYERVYIEFSALGRAILPLGSGRASLYALAGPAVAFERKCKVEWWAVTGPSSRISRDFSQCQLPLDADSSIELEEGADFGAIGGLGADVALWDMRLSVEVLYTFGLRSDGSASEAVRNRVRTVQFGLSLPFR